MIYKICSRELWDNAVKEGRFAGAPIDLQDGFIHFSTAKQVKETAAKHFAGQDDLLLIEFDESEFGDDLKWEVSRGGDLFPHLYAELPPDAAKLVNPLPLSNSGEHLFPPTVVE